MVDTRDLKSLGQKRFKVKQAKPDEAKRLDTEMSYGQDSR